MDTLVRDVRYAVRSLRRTPGFTIAGVCVRLLAVASLAGYLPARRAARIDPVEALRAE